MSDTYDSPRKDSSCQGCTQLHREKNEFYLYMQPPPSLQQMNYWANVTYRVDIAWTISIFAKFRYLQDVTAYNFSWDINYYDIWGKTIAVFLL